MATGDLTPYGRVYLITNTVNAKKYVGQTVLTLAQRWSKHVRPGSGCRALASAIKKHGVDAFSIEELGVFDSLDDLNAYEELMVIEHDCISPSGYNLKTGGGRGRHSEDSLRLMREKMLVRWQDPEYRAQAIAKKQTPEFKAKLRASRAKLLADTSSNLSQIYAKRDEEKSKKKAEYNLPEAKQRREELKLAKLSLASKTRWQDPAHIERMRLACIKKWEGEEYRTAMLEKARSPEVRRKRSDAIRLAAQREGVSEKRSAMLQAMWANPSFREKMLTPERIAGCRARASARVWSEESRSKLSASNMGRIQSPETRAKISASRMGHGASAETRAKLRAASTGRSPSAETRAKLRDANLGKSPSAETRAKLRASNPRRRAIRCIETGEVFASISDAGRRFGSNGNAIGQCCRGNSKSAHGLRFEYIGENA